MAHEKARAKRAVPICSARKLSGRVAARARLFSGLVESLATGVAIGLGIAAGRALAG
jgi:hypothetical protein